MNIPSRERIGFLVATFGSRPVRPAGSEFPLCREPVGWVWGRESQVWPGVSPAAGNRVPVRRVLALDLTSFLAVRPAALGPSAQPAPARVGLSGA